MSQDRNRASGGQAFAPGAVWDRRRNSSQVFGVEPDALPKAMAALGALRQSDPALVAWLEEGYPRLTEADHLRRFGEAYTKRATKATP